MVEQRLGDEPLKVFKRALDNVRPRVEVKSRRVGGCDLPGAHRGAAGARHRAGHALDHPVRRAPVPGKSMRDKLAAEFIDAAG